MKTYLQLSVLIVALVFMCACTVYAQQENETECRCDYSCDDNTEEEGSDYMARTQCDNYYHKCCILMKFWVDYPSSNTFG
ncbi:Hypothetical predicted protein [Mytilus galloprovincialis]|uniref:Uncharacterized protein n=1 Tax=Mytilus galloprovincialis TaxID=29158 RepID=A0A8B6BYK9_MYTGA|nr:Hypothetical predicted protein [Mytilus galloprovincialis]